MAVETTVITVRTVVVVTVVRLSRQMMRVVVTAVRTV